jgi:hypothetical protein
VSIFKTVIVSTLTLLVPGLSGADDANDTLTLNDLAVPAHLFY